MTEPSDFERADDPNDPHDVDADELASAFVDGEVSDAEAAQIEADPDLMRRVVEFQAVQASTAEVIAPPSDAVRASHIAAAMAAFGSPVAGDDEAGDGEAGDAEQPMSAAAGAVDLRDHRMARAERGNRLLLTLAAAFVVIGGIGLASWQLGGSDDEDFAATSLADDAVTSTTPSASNAADAGDALEAEAASEEAEMDLEVEAMEEAMEDDEAGSDAAASEAIEAGDESADFDDAMEDDSASDDVAGDVDTGGALRLVAPTEELTIDELFEQSAPADMLALEESLCAASLDIVDGGWFIVETVDGTLAEFIVEFTADGGEIGRLVDETCTPILE